MSPEAVLDIFSGGLRILVTLILVILLPSLVVGFIVSMFQAATQINEQTLSFVPKLLTTLLILLFAGPWMLNLIIEYTVNLISSIPMLIG